MVARCKVFILHEPLRRDTIDVNLRDIFITKTTILTNKFPLLQKEGKLLSPKLLRSLTVMTPFPLFPPAGGERGTQGGEYV